MNPESTPPAPAREARLRILHLEDSPNDAELVRATLTAEGIDFELLHVADRAQFLHALDARPFDLILADHSLPGFDGTAALGLARERWPETPFIFVTGSLGEESAIEKFRQGATDYVLKERLTRLVPAVQRALREAAERAGRRRAEVALRQSEEQFRAFMDHARIAAFIKDAAGRYVYVNRLVGENLQMETAAALAKTDFDLLPADAARHVREHDAQVFATGQPLEVIEALPTPEGKYRYWLTSKFPMPGPSGQPLLGGVAIDITAHRRAQAQLRQSQEQLAEAQAIANVGSWSRDLTTNAMTWSDELFRIFGLVPGQTEPGLAAFLARIFPEDQSLLEDSITRLLREGQSPSIDFRIVRPDGAVRTVHGRAKTAVDVVGQPVKILGIIQDITEKKQLEAQFLRAQRLESLGTLAGGIAHDLNNVLAPILMGVQVMRMEEHAEANQVILDTLESSAKRGANLVKQVLSFARGAEGQRAALQLKHLVADQARIVCDTFPRSIQVRTKVDKDLWSVVADATQLHQVLMNLCVNARDAMPQGGTLRIGAENLPIDEVYARQHPEAKAGPYVMVEVEDTGTGIPPAIVGKIFDPFFTTKDVSKGTGLGLSTVMGIVKTHGGFIDVESQVGRGTTFKIYLPAAETAQTIDAVGVPPETPRGQGEGVLVVDDEATIREIVKRTLEFYGYRVLTANDGIEALAIYANRKDDIDLVVTDLMMPFMDGLTTIRTLRRLNSGVKVIAITGLFNNLDPGELQRAGVAQFLQKPFTTQQLLEALHVTLHPAAPPPA